MERKGICKNIGVCTKANKVQIIHEDADFVCSECGSPLEEYVEEEEKSGKNPKRKLIILVIIAIIIIGGIIVALLIQKSDTELLDKTTQTETTEETQEAGVVTETITVTVTETVTEIVAAPSSKPIANSGGTLSLSYGTYKGATKRGYAHGQGRLTYKTDRIINRNDPKQRKAKAGDYIIGEFYNGFVVYGKHYNASGELIESLTFGVASEDSYELK